MTNGVLQIQYFHFTFMKMINTLITDKGNVVKVLLNYVSEMIETVD